MHVDNKLNFNVHISKLCQKAGRQVSVISRLCNVLDQSSKMLLYNSFIECYFSYCSVLWHFCSNSNTYKVEKIQKRALKFITNDFTSEYNVLLEKCKKSPLYIVRTRKFLEVVFRILNGMYPGYLTSFLSLKDNALHLRSVKPLNVPTFKTIKYGKSSMRYIAPHYWNKSPNDLKNCQNINCFKSILKEWCPVCTCGFCVLCRISNL